MIKFKDFKRKNILLIALIPAVVGSFNLLLLFLLIGGNAGVYSWGGTMKGEFRLSNLIYQANGNCAANF